jgi:hypothetical protein
VYESRGLPDSCKWLRTFQKNLLLSFWTYTLQLEAADSSVMFIITYLQSAVITHTQPQLPPCKPKSHIIEPQTLLPAFHVNSV